MKNTKDLRSEDGWPAARDEIASALSLACQENNALIAQRDEAIEALRALVSTAIRHRWRVNSDEPDTINSAMDLLAKTAPPNPNAGVVQVSPKGRWTTEEAEEEGLKIMKEQEGTP